jgi:hypothetical protein
LAAAVKEKMKCILILEESQATDFDTLTNGNYFLYAIVRCGFNQGSTPWNKFSRRNEEGGRANHSRWSESRIPYQ